MGLFGWDIVNDMVTEIRVPFTRSLDEVLETVLPDHW